MRGGGGVVQNRESPDFRSLAVARDILGSLTPSTTLPHGAGANLLLPVVPVLVL